MQITVYTSKGLLEADPYESNCRGFETNKQVCEVGRV